MDAAFSDPLNQAAAAANNSGVEGLSNDNLAPVGDQKGGAMSKRVSRAIMKFLRESRRGGGRKSPSYRKGRKRMQNRRNRRRSRARSVRAYPLVGSALDTVIKTAAKPVRFLDDRVIKPVLGRGRSAIRFVGSPATRFVKSLGKKGRRSGKKLPKKAKK